MSHPQWQQHNEHQVMLSGALDLEQVPALWRYVQRWQPQSQQCQISLKQVDRIDSAGMVMLIHLIEHAKKQNCHIMLDFVPQQLSTLLQLSNIETLLAEHINDKLR